MTLSFDDAGRAGRAFLEASLDSLNAISRDVQEIGGEASDYAEKAIGAGGETFGKLMSAKSVEKAMQIQGEYYRQAYEGFVAQQTKLAGLYADMAKHANRPFESIVARAK
jgi:hypothetical protein